MNSLKKKGFVSLTIYSAVVMLAGLFISCIIQGVLVQIGGNGIGGTVLYITGFLSIAASVYVYQRGKVIIDNIL